jgi:light-regulated signal transduction histidine kinase (bacteriophytochrome)
MTPIFGLPHPPNGWGNEEFVNLTNCDREPIHIPGSIQPHGVLLVLTEPDLQILQVSNNCQPILGLSPRQLCDRPLADLLLPEPIGKIRDHLERGFDPINPLSLKVATSDGSLLSFNGIVHRSPSGELLLEIEPQGAIEINDPFECHRQMKHLLTQLQQVEHLQTLWDLLVREIRQLTGFDRVMIYRFNPRCGDGEVIAEDKRPELEPYLGLHYPDSDIPKQAKALYTLNWLRLIPDVNYQPVGLFPERPQAGPLDMSYSVLRSVSPIHIEYLQNMGVAASMSISLIHEQELWGLIACHHQTPKFVSYEIRLFCECLGQLISTALPSKQTSESLDYQLSLKQIREQLVDRLMRASQRAIDENADSAIPVEPVLLAQLLAADRASDGSHYRQKLLQLTGAQGAAVCEGDEIALIGQTPTQEQIRPLLNWLSDRLTQPVWFTESLGSLYPPAQEFQGFPCGLLVIAISQLREDYILWFRPEVLQTVQWAGNPEKAQQIEADGTLTLLPRTSFEAWQETVRGRSKPWLNCEVAGAIELRGAIVDVVLKQAQQLAQINQELERSNHDLDAFAYIASHDLKEPLRGIHNYATFLLEDYASLLPSEGTDKLDTLVRLTERMSHLIDALLRFSRLGRQELQMQPLDLDRLLGNITEVFQMHGQSGDRLSDGSHDRQIQVASPLPRVWGDRLLVEEIFMNLISNALKYNDQEEKIVRIGSYPGTEKGQVILYVQDNGIGIRQKHLDTVFRIFKRLHAPGKYGGGTGAGLTIVKKIIERHGGKIWVESVYRQGTTFLFTLPTGPAP